MIEEIRGLEADFARRIVDIQDVGNVNSELIKIAVSQLRHLEKEIKDSGKFQGLLVKVQRQIEMYDQVSRLPGVSEKLPVIYEQMIVLMVGALEAYLSDLFRGVSNTNPSFLVWKSEKEKISFEPILLQDNEKFTLGDVILSHLKGNGVSFQDLRSTIEALERYLDIEVKLSDADKDELIYVAACRNVIVHNKSTIDPGFLKQVRKTKYASLKKDSKLEITDEYVKSVGVLLNKFCNDITNKIVERTESNAATG